MTAEIPNGLEYTYGSRFRSPQDQIQSIIDQINEEDYTRRAVAVTWNVSTDDGNPKAPCLVIIQALVSSGKLYLTCYIRSNDMYGAWPQNAFALRNIQKEVADATGKWMGKLTIISVSAHIYERDYERVLMTVMKHKPRAECVHDPRGNFVIRLRDDRIVITHLNSIGSPLQEFGGVSAQSIMDQIYPFISDVSHALYLGGELQRAEIALKGEIPFAQK
jgi:thymidylate synthase